MFRSILLKTRPVRYAYDAWTYRRSSAERNLLQWKNAWSGMPVLIVGNGPSLNDTPLDQFVGVNSIGMNKINLIYSKTTWRPSLIAAINNLVIKQNMDYYVNSDIPVFLSWKGRRYCPVSERNRFFYLLNRNTANFSTDILSGIGSSGTVTYTALQLAYYLGANPVVIVGVDHRFTFNGKPNDVQVLRGPDINHFDPNYFSGNKWGVPNLERSENAFHQSRLAFEADGRSIFDATINGALTIFDKITINEAISIFKSKH